MQILTQNQVIEALVNFYQCHLKMNETLGIINRASYVSNQSHQSHVNRKLLDRNLAQFHTHFLLYCGTKLSLKLKETSVSIGNNSKPDQLDKDLKTMEHYTRIILKNIICSGTFKISIGAILRKYQEITMNFRHTSYTGRVKLVS